MSIRREANGRRSVQVEVEVPGTPEEVWQAIATGPGISSWFVPTKVEEREGGTTTSDFGPGMESIATITAWEPPHRFTADSPDLGPDSPHIATEWSVEAHSGDVCVVRVVHSFFASTDDWDNQLEAWEGGWPGFFNILRLYLTHFRGLSCTPFPLMGVSTEPEAEAWNKVITSLSLTDIQLDKHWQTGANVPPLAGTLEVRGPAEFPHTFLFRLDQPTTGLAHLFAMTMGDQVYISFRFYLYGNQAAEIATRDEPLWKEWMERVLG